MKPPQLITLAALAAVACTSSHAVELTPAEARAIAKEAYIYAFPVQQTLAWVGGAAWPHVVYLAACFLLCLSCAVASWYGIEHPALRLKPRRAAPATHVPADTGLIQGKAAGSGGP